LTGNPAKEDHSWRTVPDGQLPPNGFDIDLQPTALDLVIPPWLSPQRLPQQLY
jgi:hypothetical protein